MRSWLKAHGRALILLPWIGLLCGLLISGAYMDYVAEWHYYLQIIALALLGFTFVGELIRSSLARVAELQHGPGCSHEHHSHGAPLSKTLVLAHLVPLALFLAVGPPQMGLDPALNNSPAYESAPLINYPTTRKPEYTQDGYLNTDLVRLHLGYKDTNELPAKVCLLGQLYRMSEADLEKDVAGLREKGIKNYVYRFIMTCCAADARPVSIGLLYDKPIEFEHGAWLEVKGQPIIVQGKSEFIVLKLHEIKQVPRPPDPYLFSLS